MPAQHVGSVLRTRSSAEGLQGLLQLLLQIVVGCLHDCDTFLPICPSRNVQKQTAPAACSARAGHPAIHGKSLRSALVQEQVTTSHLTRYHQLSASSHRNFSFNTVLLLRQTLVTGEASQAPLHLDEVRGLQRPGAAALHLHRFDWDRRQQIRGASDDRPPPSGE